MTGKQMAQAWAQIERMERLTRGNELETPFVVLMRICRDYAAKCCVFDAPETERAAREELIRRLDKFRIKYFAKI